MDFGGEQIIIIRNNNNIARLIPGSARMTALEAVAVFLSDFGAEMAKDERIPLCYFRLVAERDTYPLPVDLNDT